LTSGKVPRESFKVMRILGDSNRCGNVSSGEVMITPLLRRDYKRRRR